MTYIRTEVIDQLFAALEGAQEKLGQEMVAELVTQFVGGWRPADRLYQPDDVLRAKIEEFNRWCEGRPSKDVGELMEEIALLALRCLSGWNSIKSYQSFAPQLDLVITGNSLKWHALMQFLRIKWECRTIVVEAKHLKGKVEDKHFSRLCSILDSIFQQQAGLGIFFTRHGATGFPSDPDTPLRKLASAQATQIIFHAKTGKYVIVLDAADIRRLGEPGALVDLLERKIRAVEEWTGLPIEPIENEEEIVLPVHLAQHMK